MKTILNSDRFELVSNLTTITAIKLQSNLWKIVENGKYSGEKSDSKIEQMVSNLTQNGFNLRTPELNY